MTQERDARGYGYRARIGYTSPPLTSEIFPYEFYRLAPDGVTLPPHLPRRLGALGHGARGQL